MNLGQHSGRPSAVRTVVCMKVARKYRWYSKIRTYTAVPVVVALRADCARWRQCFPGWEPRTARRGRARASSSRESTTINEYYPLLSA
eukprot:2663551-Pleurochrysis_carterae.AAC.1